MIVFFVFRAMEDKKILLLFEIIDECSCLMSGNIPVYQKKLLKNENFQFY
jgi:hypothetical protein